MSSAAMRQLLRRDADPTERRGHYLGGPAQARIAGATEGSSGSGAISLANDRR
jgi:hypothetical protein